MIGVDAQDHSIIRHHVSVIAAVNGDKLQQSLDFISRRQTQWLKSSTDVSPNAEIGRHPKLAARRDEHLINANAVQPLRGGELRYGGTVITEESVLRADPQEPLLVLGQAGHRGSGETELLRKVLEAV